MYNRSFLSKSGDAAEIWSQHFFLERVCVGDSSGRLHGLATLMIEKQSELFSLMTACISKMGMRLKIQETGVQARTYCVYKYNRRLHTCIHACMHAYMLTHIHALEVQNYASPTASAES